MSCKRGVCRSYVARTTAKPVVQWVVLARGGYAVSAGGRPRDFGISRPRRSVECLHQRRNERGGVAGPPAADECKALARGEADDPALAVVTGDDVHDARLRALRTQFAVERWIDLAEPAVGGLHR